MDEALKFRNALSTSGHSMTSSTDRSSLEPYWNIERGFWKCWRLHTFTKERAICVWESIYTTSLYDIPSWVSTAPPVRESAVMGVVRGTTTTNEHIFGIVPGTGGVKIASVLLGFGKIQETHQQNFQEVSGNAGTIP